MNDFLEDNRVCFRRMIESRGVNENNVVFVTLENKMFNRRRAGVQIITNFGQRFSSGRIDKLGIGFNAVFSQK